ncbi:hypothetical protein D9M73_179460 [compost metagenome]
MRKTHRAPGIANHDRLDRCEAVHEFQADLLGTLTELADQRLQMLAAPVFAAQQFQAFQRGAGQRGGLAGGVDVGAGELDQAFDQLFAASHKGTRRTERLAEGADQHRNVILAQAKVFDDAATVGTQRSKTMGIVDHQPGAFGLGFSGQRRQVGKITVHAEHAVGDHQCIAGGFFQALGQARRVVVQITIESRAGQQPRVEQRRMIEPVFEHRITLPHNAVTAPRLAM